MMIHAYEEFYVNDVKKNLAIFFDYIINDCGIRPDLASSIFLSSGVAAQIEKGNPAFISGMSGVELGRYAIQKTFSEKELPKRVQPNDYSPEYWSGWSLSSYQWKTNIKFKKIFELIPLSEVIGMYNPLHEADISIFESSMNKRVFARTNNNKIKMYRVKFGYSQADLARLSGVGIRSIRAYEQKTNDIDKAEVHTVYKLARVFGCTIEELID